ncbi:MAG: DegV family protein [Anaerolineae bacterium]|nr:DegV family protein [Anaerolineae bacterium]
MAIRIVTDSTCDLPAEVAERYGILVVPMYIHVDGRSYLDVVELSRQDFYAELPRYTAPPQTSAPGPEMLVQMYEGLAAEGATEILSIHVASSLSSFVNAARVAARSTRGARVTVFDSGQLSLGGGLLALAAARAVANGCTLDEVVTLIEKKAHRTFSFAILNTLEYLRRSGRATALQAGVGTLLRVKPLISIHDNTLTMERPRTTHRAIARMAEHIAALPPLEEYALVHTHAPDKARELGQHLQDLLPRQEDVFCVDVTPAIGTHLGPDGIGIICVTSP